MISVSAPLKALLDSGAPLWAADLYTITLLTGSVLRYTSSDVDVTFGGNTWYTASAGMGIRINRGKIRLVIGTEVDSLSVDLFPIDTDVISSNPILRLAMNGGFDNCVLQLDRAFSPGPGQAITGIVPKRFLGRIAPITGGRSQLNLTVKSDLERLNINMPRVLWQPACSHALYDASCALNKATFTVTGTVTSVAAGSYFTDLVAASGYYTLGVMTFTTGVNAGLARTVKVYGGSGLVMPFPFPQDAALGDQFQIYPGCDKTRGAQGCAKFSNEARYRGFPYVPNPEVGMP